MTQPTIDQAMRLAMQKHRAGRLAEAQAIYQQVLQHQPNHAEALHMLGVMANQVGQTAAALQLLGRAVALRANDAAYHMDLGIALQATGDYPSAAAAYRKAVELRADFGEAWNNLGNMLKDMGRLDDADEAYARALPLLPKAWQVPNNLGMLRKEQGNIPAALEFYRQAMALEPDNPTPYDNLLFAMHFDPAADAASILAEHRRWNEIHAAGPPMPADAALADASHGVEPPLMATVLPIDRPLRIGYVSGDFREHPVGRFMAPLLEQHDRSAFPIICYSNSPAVDEMTQALHAHADLWRNIANVSDDDAARLMREDKIDILVDLSMHSDRNRLRLFARKPAPVQATYLAYCSTTGVPAIDFRLTDPYLDPPGTDADYSEQSVRLPATYWVYRPPSNLPEPGPLPMSSAGHVTFGCLNNFCKASDDALATWARVLSAVPGSKLILHVMEGRHRQRIFDIFSRHGIEASRLELFPLVPAADYFAAYQRIDIALDTFPCAGGTTTCDALWMGVPVVSLRGRTGVGRVGVSVVSNVGLGELVAEDMAGYVEIARALAANEGRLTEMRAGLRDRMKASPLMDARRFARDVESAYQWMWNRRAGGSRE